MTDTNAVRERVVKLFASALHLDVPSVDTDLFDAGVLDSFAFVELLLQLEQEFGITTAVEDLEADNFKSVAHIADFVMQRLAAAGPRCQPAGGAR